MTDEEYVRSRWENVAFTGGDNQIIPGAGFVSTDVMAISNIKSSPEQAWEQAAEFTRQREEEIRLLREEIAWVRETLRLAHDNQESLSHPILADAVTINQRILARLESELAELLIGWKEQG